MRSTSKLSAHQLAALEHIDAYARTRKERALAEIEHVLRMSNITNSDFDDAVGNIMTHARVALHFHPDRPDSDMRTVAESLLESGLYKSQFETMLSSGSVSAFPGGERDQWEERIFGGAYHSDGVTNKHRPKYGALNLMLHPDGPSPRFGSCYFLLKPSVSQRCTFTYLDSHYDPAEKGTYAEFDDIVAALLVEAFVRDSAIGEANLTPKRLIRHLNENLRQPFADPSQRAAVRNLNHYIEAQVHGDVSLTDDVDLLVAEPSFRGTETGQALEQICRDFEIDLHWYCGFAVPVDEVPDDFRGSTMPSLAKRIATQSYLTASMIGPAAFDLKRNPESWSDRGEYKDVLQELKILWHVLVRCGRPLRSVAAVD